MKSSRIELTPMTAEMYHLFFLEYENDPDVFLPGQEYVHYEYSEEKVVKYIRHSSGATRGPICIWGSGYSDALCRYD